MEKTFNNCDLIKFIARHFNNEIEATSGGYQTPEFDKLEKFVNKEIPGDEFEKNGFEFSYVENGFAESVYVLDKHFELGYEEPFLDEEELTYSEDPLDLMNVEISKPGFEVIPNITIGQNLDFKKIADVVLENLPGEVVEYYIDILDVIEYHGPHFTMTFDVLGGTLVRVRVMPLVVSHMHEGTNN